MSMVFNLKLLTGGLVKTISFLIFVMVAFAIAFHNTNLLQVLNTTSHKSEVVNYLIGDISFVEKYGTFPDRQVSEKLRISTHLEYVENQLRQISTWHLNDRQREARLRNIEFLHAYRTNELFPKNYDYPTQRMPCFIDKDGAICAVGYLIEKTAGREFAEAINAEYQYGAILDIESTDFETWVFQSGLTKMELAMIQPSYDFRKENKISKELELLSMGLSGSSAILNGIYTGKRERHALSSSLGILLGATNLLMGLSDKSNYSLPDLFFGASSIVSGVMNLSFGKKREDSKHRESMFQKPEITLAAIPLERHFGLGLGMKWTF